MNERITSLEALQEIKHKVLEIQRQYRLRLMLCGGTGCRASGTHSFKAALSEEIRHRGLNDEILVTETGCNGFCAVGPVMLILPEDTFYLGLRPEDVPEIVEQHLIKGRRVDRLLFEDPITKQKIPCMHDIPFFSHQLTWTMRNKGYIDPEQIDEYIARDGYAAAAKALFSMTPDEIISEVKTSGLRGRGGAGFPTGLKWDFAKNAAGDTKYVLCNADEGDPGAFMDRSILEADPHSVLEGMLIAAVTIGARQGFIYCRAEYPLAIDRLTIAIQQAEHRGLLGKDIMDSGMDFTIEIYKGAGAFVCGEETALMRSIEGRRGMPRPRPPFPAVSGLWGKPSLLNNVETWSSVPRIIWGGGDLYAKIGTESSKGTKVFAVTGKINNIGLVEVPMGTPIGDIVFDIGGGIPGKKKFKAAQLGGPSGGCVPAEHLNLPTDYEAIARAGAIMGSGGMIVMDEDTCMVDMARYFMEFCQDESCGKCTPCRIGTRRMLEILENICRGKGEPEDIERLETLAESIRDTALCGLGQTAPNPVFSTLRYFLDEYKAHIFDKKCPAGVCADLFNAPCQNGCPVEMDIPAYIALIRAGRLDDAYQVLKQTNPFPSVCGRVCGHPCQDRCRRSQLDDALAIKDLKRFITDYTTPPEVDPVPTVHTERIAVIGAGPAGLTAALEMKKRGYDVTVFEALPEAGGMLRWGIPAYRLPRDILDREIQEILDTGVVLKTGTKIGQDLLFADLESQFDAVYISTGAQKSMPLGLAGENAEGVMGAVEFLRAWNMGQPVTVGKRVAVIGGGNSAVDAARTAVRLGADTVSIIYRREQQDMPALEAEIRAAQEEGVTIECLAAPVEIIKENNRISALKLSRMQLGSFDTSGRRRPVAVEGGEFVIPVDTLIPAIGQKAELESMPETIGPDMKTTRIPVGKDFSTSHPKVWAGGDVVTGPAMVIDAIAAGRKAAASMDKALRAARGEHPSELSARHIEIPFEVDEEIVEQPRAKMEELAPADRCSGFDEVELGFDRDAAMNEARRCIRCDVKIEQG
jgi:NADH-quinone oxidoreductase subunit F